MLIRSMIGSIALAATFVVGPAAAQQPLGGSGKYPDMAGQWMRVWPLGVYDSTKPPARGQQAPLTPEYQARFEATPRSPRAVPVMTPFIPASPKACRGG
jgi:hypothetical protein